MAKHKSVPDSVKKFNENINLLLNPKGNEDKKTSKEENAKRNTSNKASGNTQSKGASKTTSGASNSILDSARRAVAENRATHTKSSPDSVRARKNYAKKKADSFGITVDQYREVQKNPDNYKIRLALQDGPDFGEISFSAYNAIEKGQLDSYMPINDAERTALEEFKKYTETDFQKRAREFDNETAKAYQEAKVTAGNSAESDKLVADIAEAYTKFTNAQRAYLTVKPTDKNFEKIKQDFLDAKEEYARVFKPAKGKYDLYSDISKFDDDSHKDTFGGQTAANYRYADLSRKTDKAWDDYYRNPTETNKEIAYAYDALVKSYAQNNEKALDDENVKLSWISKSAAGYMPQLIDQLPAQTVAFVAGSIGGAPGASIGAGLATAAQSYSLMRGSAYRTLLEAGVDEEIAREAANDEALINSLIEGAETAFTLSSLGIGKGFAAIKTAAKRVAGKETAKVATKAIAKALTPKAVNKIAKEASKSTARKVLGGIAKLGLNGLSEYGEEALQQGVSIANERRVLGDNPDESLLIDSAKLWHDAAIGKDKEARAEMHNAGKEGWKVGIMLSGAGIAGKAGLSHTVNAINNNATVNAIIKDNKKLTAVIEQGKVMGVGTAPYNIATEIEEAKANGDKVTVKQVKKLTSAIQNEAIDFIIQDDESITALIEEGKASGKNSVSYKIAEEIEKSRENGKVTRSQVKRLIASNEVYIANEERNAAETDKTPSAGANIPIANNTPVQIGTSLRTASETAGVGNQLEVANERATQAAYEAGREGTPIDGLSFVTEEQQEAYFQGRREYVMNMPAKSSKTIVPDAELDINEGATVKSEQPFISDRTYEEVGNRKVKAFQYENPEVKPFYKEIAQELKADIANTIKGERVPITDGDGYVDSYTGVSRITSESVERIKDSLPNSPTYADIENALDRIINDNGQENTALAKRIELVIDDMLTEGYTTFDGYKVPPNDDYIAVKNSIGGIETEVDTRTTASVVDDLLGETENSPLQTDTQYDRMIPKQNGVKGAENNGIGESGTIYQNDVGYSEIQGRTETNGVHNRSTQIGNTERGQSFLSRGSKKVETRTLKTLVKDSKFNKLYNYVGNEITDRTYYEITKNYDADIRVGEYGLVEVATYDMLTNPDNELRTLFADNIAEYFGEANPNTDIAGNVVSDEALKKLANSVVRTENGQLIPLYHATDKAYDRLRAGDIGIHFGSYTQATQRATDKGIAYPVFIKSYLNITNPLVIDEDFTNWNAPQLAKKLESLGALTHKEGLSFINGGVSAENNARLVELLKSKGYDGISYTNEYESGAGTSYIVFDDSQIIRTEDAETVENADVPNTDIYNKTLLTNFGSAVDGVLTDSDEIARQKAENRVAIQILKNTPDVILNNVAESSNLPVIINYTKLYLATREKGVIKGHYHNFGKKIKLLPDFLKNPDIILRMENGRINLITSVNFDSENSSLVSVELNSEKDIDGKNKPYNVVVTVFAPTDNYLSNIINDSKNKIVYRKRGFTASESPAVQYPATVNDKSSSVDTIVSQDTSAVNTNIRKNSESDTSQQTAENDTVLDAHDKKVTVDVVKKVEANSTDIKKIKTLPNVGKRFVSGLEKLGQGLDIDIKVYNGKKLGVEGVDGFYDKATRTMYLDYNHPTKPIQSVVRHEVIHVFRQMTSKGFKAFSDFVVKKYKARHGEAAYNAYIKNKKAEYAAMGRELTNDGAMEELCADFGMDMMQNKADVKAFIANNKGFANKLREAISKIENIVRKAFGIQQKVTVSDAMRELAGFDSTVSTTSGKVERSHTPYGYDNLPAALSVAEMNEAQEIFLNAIAEYEKAQRYVWNRHSKELKALDPAKRRQRAAELIAERLGEEYDSGDDVKFSVVEPFTDKNGKTFKNAVLLDTDFFDGISPRNWGEHLKMWINNRASTSPAIMPITDENGNTVILEFAKTNEYVSKNGGANHKVLNKFSTTSDNISKLSVIHIDEVVSVSEKNSPYHTSENSHEWFDKNGWLHRNANVINAKNGAIYNLTLDIAKAADGRIILYATDGKIKKVGNAEVNSLKIKGSRLNSNSKGSVTHPDEKVKRNISFSATIPKGENPARDIDVPAEDRSGGRVSHHVRTILEAAATPDGYVSPIMEDVLDGKYSHEVITDEAAQESAFKRISREETNGAGKVERVLDTEKYKRVLNDTLERFENNELDGKNDMAILQALYANAANSYDYMNQVDENGVPLAEKLIIAMVQTSSKAGQTLQASRLLKKTSPAGKLYDLEMFVKNTNKEIKAQWGDWVDNANAEAEQQWGKSKDGRRDYKVDKEAKKRRRDSRRRGMTFSKHQKDIVLNKKLVETLLSAKNQEEANAIEDKLVKDIAGQIKSTVGDKLRSLRYTAMLMNPRTHVRNVVGNTMFAGIVETRNAIDATLQAAIIKDKSKRTKALALTPSQRAEQKRLIGYADKLFAEQTQYIRGESGKYDTYNNAIDENRKIFGFKPLEGARRINFNLLEGEDVMFIRYHFRRHFANELLAKGIKLSDIENGRVSNKVIEDAMRSAAEQAQKATFRDASDFAKAMNRLEKTNLATELVASGVIPFKKTPINILKRGVEYSPLSIVKAGYRAISENVSVKKGTLDSVDVAGILGNLSEGLTGTAIFVLGAWLLRTGVLAILAGDDEDEEKLGEAMGHQGYALEVGDYSFTIDWAAPAVMPLFMGAEVARSLDDGMGVSVLETLARMSDPVIETSMLSGVLGVFDSIRYSEKGSDVVVDLTTEVMSSYLMQYVPSIFGAVARTFDEVESRTSRPSVNGDEGFMEMLGRKAANKVPVLRSIVGSKPYVDIMGKYEVKDDAGDYLVSFMQNFILPGYVSKITSSDATAELCDVVEAAQRTDVIPKYVSKVGEHKLTHDEYFEFHEARGALYDEVIPYLAEQGWYNECSAGQKAEILKDFKEAADKLTKKRIVPSYNLNNKKLESIYANGASAAEVVNIYLVDKYIGLSADVNGDGELERAEVVGAITEMDVDNDAAWDLYLSKYDSKTASEAEGFGIDAKLFMTAVADMDGIKADYRENGKIISGSRRAKVERYLNSVCSSYKEYLFLLGMEYPSIKKDADYISYFGR